MTRSGSASRGLLHLAAGASAAPRRPLPGLVAILAWGLLLVAAFGSGATAPARAEVVVTEVRPGGMAEAIGMQVGQKLVRWQLLDAEGASVDEGPLADPFTLTRVQFELAPRGPIRLLGPGTDEVHDLPWEEWNLEVRPPLPDSIDGDGTGRNGALEAAEAATDPRHRAWWWAAAADARAEEDDDPTLVAEEVDALYRRAVDTAAASPVALAQLHRRWGDHARDRSAWEQARSHYETALALDEAREGGTLGVARDHLRLATLEGRRRSLTTSREHYERALEILRAEARPGLVLAQTLGGFSYVLNVLGDMERGEEIADEALAIVERTGLEGHVARVVLNNRAGLQARRGDYAGALTTFDRIVEISAAMGVRDRALGNALHNRGVCLRRLGDLEEAERALREALAVRGGLAPESLDVAQSYEMLANVLSARADNQAAEMTYRRVVELYDRLAPDSFALAGALLNLGASLANQGRLDETEPLYRRAVDIFDRTAPGSWYHARSLQNLADLYRDLDRPVEAERLTLRSLELMRELAPGSLEEANILQSLGHLARKDERWDEALEFFLDAWAIRSRIAPGTRAAAEALYWTAAMREREGDLEEASRCYCDAIDALDAQRARLGGTERSHVHFSASYAVYANRCLESLVELGREDEALAVLERTRARFLLSLFAGREGLLEGEVPEEIEARRRAHREEVDAILSQLARLGEQQIALADSLRDSLAELERQRQQIAAELRLRAPRLEELEAIDTLDAAGIVDALDPGTMLVSYWLGSETSLAFVVPAGTGSRQVEAVPLAIGRDELAARVATFRGLITEGAPRADVDRLASSLYASLLAPVESRLARAERLLISPEGPLRLLPFAALRTGDEPGAADGRGGGRYLVEDLPVHFIDSATLYARVLERRRPFDPSTARVVAFGDPVYAPATEVPTDSLETSALVVALRERGFDLESLPGSRQEVEQLDEFFGRPVERYLGSAATEENVKALDAGVDVLHFACHAVADREIPSASSLVLSLPPEDATAGENGFLQAWEILESLRFDASLVTLSACETALGKELGGEGIAGLTRAFQYAGARSIVASLWSVPDEPTARMMRIFYENLTRGVAKDEALRRAQLALLREQAPTSSTQRAVGGLAPADDKGTKGATSSAHAFAWAAMQLIGDWR